ncbi:hypothetical protein [Actinoplanes sp. NPDC051411]|uniref:hypothetical protein n=1 Tax=Actinoplanes sp. NPDC051411 TaxID=3155522 RepID=UPI00342DDC4D
MTDLLNEQWAQDLAVRVETLRRLKDIACAGADPGPSAAAVDAFLDRADAAVRKQNRRGRPLLDHWRGLSVTTAFENVHAAEVFLVDLMTEEQIRVLLPSVMARARAVLDADDPRLHDIRKLTEDDLFCRTHFQQAMRAGFTAEDQIFARVRTFRNLVVKCTGLLIVMVGVMVALVTTHPESMPLCFAPGGGLTMACPHGDHTLPTAEDILIVVGLGLLGSAAAAAFAIRGLHGIPTPYDIPVALAVFKLPLGAFTAVTGLLLLGGDFVPGFSALDSQRQILAYALTFGYAQQLVSRLIDNRARAIVSRLPVAVAGHADRP